MSFLGMGNHRAHGLSLLLAVGATLGCSSDEGGGSNQSGDSGAMPAGGGGGLGATGGTGAGGAAASGGVSGSGGAANCSDPGPASNPTWEALEADAIARINQERQAGATCGTDDMAPVATVARDDALTRNARAQCVHMSANGLGITGPDGSPASEWGLRCFGGTGLALNVSMGHADANALIDSLMMDPATCANLFASATHVGVGFYSTASPDAGSGGQRYWTVLLAQ